ncbi:MAG: HD domain-containing phosphohydrolase [Pseudomonadota bacterium]
MVRIAEIVREEIGADETLIPDRAPAQEQRDSTPREKDVNFRLSSSLADEMMNRQVASAQTGDVEGHDYSLNEHTEKNYARLLVVAREVMRNAENGLPLDCRSVERAAGDLIDEFVSGNEQLIAAACSPVKGDENYLYAHIVNVTILSLAMGMDQKLNISKLIDLGVSSFFHDVGITRVLHLVNKQDYLSPSEKGLVREHPMFGVEILKKTSGISDTVLKVVYQEHERLDGSGYPEGITDAGKLDECSRIVAVADVFEAITHRRPHRDGVLPHEAMKRMLGSEEVVKFDSGVLKSLVNRVGIYPVGSWVRLSNGEVARVVGLNAGRALKPKVKVIFDKDGWKLREARLLNMADCDAIQIVKLVGDSELNGYFNRSLI